MGPSEYDKALHYLIIIIIYLLDSMSFVNIYFLGKLIQVFAQN